MKTKIQFIRQIFPNIQTTFMLGFFFFFISASAQTPNWVWAGKAGSMAGDGYGGMKTDPQGNVYLTGYFGQPITIGTYTLINSDTSNATLDIFVAKYDSNGNVIWAKQMGRKGSEMSSAITIDSGGNIYVGGQFGTDSLFFGGDTLVNAYTGRDDAFILKYDSNGNELWAKSAGNIWYDQIYSATIDQSGNIYFTGGFMATTITFGSFTLNNPYLYSINMFIVKYDPNGNIIWAKTVGGTSSVTANSISIDPLGNIFVGGYFNSTQLIIGTDTLWSAGGADIFLAKYDTNGNALWGKSAGSDQWDLCYSLIADASGNACIVGNFSSSSIVFGTDTLIENGAYNMFVTKYDSNGNPLWAKNASGIGNAVSANAITTDVSGNFFVGGNFYWPRLIIGNDTLLNFDTLHHNNTFVAKYNTNGTEIWAKGNGGNDNDEIYSLSTDLSGNIYAAGFFASPTMAFDTITLNNTSSAIDIFVSKMQIPNVITNIKNPELNIIARLYPNPFNLCATIEFNTTLKNGELNIYNIYGQKLKSIKNISGTHIKINREDLCSGVYFYELKQDNKNIATDKLIVRD